MSVIFTKDKEKQRVAKIYNDVISKTEKSKWEFLETTNMVNALRTARDMGWKDNKVQVRYVTIGEETTYFVEPYEKNCGCRGILKYKEFFN